MVTVFNNYSNTKTPQHVEIDKVLEGIQKCRVQKQIDEIQAETDSEKKKLLKKQLPCILFSGKFSERKDKSLLEHSGFVVLDWDHLDNLEAKKLEISKLPFVYSCFISPSGDGLKAVVRIPAIIEKHRGYYKALMNQFPDLDATSINESRICYASCDKDIYINKDAIEFNEYVEQFNPKAPLVGASITAPFNDYSKANVALKMIRESIHGQRHADLLKASKLMGGFISGGLIEESEAIRLIENEIRSWDNFEANQVTIRKGVDYGKSEPIIKEEYVRKQTEVIKPESRIELSEINQFADKQSIDDYLNLWKEGKFQKGLSTGLNSFDKYFLFKRGNFNVINGFDNVGKSTGIWYICLLASMYHGWRWVIYSNENRAGTVVKKLMEFYWGEPVDRMNHLKYAQAYDFVMHHFRIISNDYMFSYKDILLIADNALSKEKFDGMIVDPYNSLSLDYAKLNKISTHEYHYEAASEMQLYTKKNDFCIYLNCHVITSALRDGSAPKKADTEGGGKFSNKADDFMTFHRETQNPETWRQMQIHVRKIKELETGGGYTPKDSPFILEMNGSGCGYSDVTGRDAVYSFHNNEVKYEATQFPGLNPNKDFDNIVDDDKAPWED